MKRRTPLFTGIVGTSLLGAGIVLSGSVVDKAVADMFAETSTLSMAALSAAGLDQLLREAGFVSDKADEPTEFEQVIELYTPLVVELRAMVAASPDDWRTVEKLKAALGYLAEGYLCLGQFEQAAALAEEGLALDDKENKFLHALLVFSYAGQGDFSKARSHRSKCDVWSMTFDELTTFYSENGRQVTEDFRNAVAGRYNELAEASRRAPLTSTNGGSGTDQSGRSSAESSGNDSGSSSSAGTESSAGSH